MSNWKRAASVADCPPGSALETVVEDRIVAIFNVDGEVYALDGICPHQGGPLGQGTLQGCIVSCPWHGWQFDVTNGQHQASETLQHQRYAVRIEGDEIQIEIEAVESA